MELAFSTNAFTRGSLDAALDAISAAGYSGVEILADRPHMYPPDFRDDQAEALGRRLRELGLSVSNVNANCTSGYFSDAPPEPFFEPSLISPDEGFRRDRLAMIERTLELARRIGAASVSITSGKLLPTVPPDRAAALLRENLARVLDAAERWGIRVGIECEPGLYVEWAEELRGLIDEMGSPLLGANLDVGHSLVAGEDIPAVIELLAGRIWNVHIEDIARCGSRRRPKHYHLVPGEGAMDFVAIRDALQRAAYVGFVTVELYTCPDQPAEAARRAMAHLREVFGAPGREGAAR